MINFIIIFIKKVRVLKSRSTDLFMTFQRPVSTRFHQVKGDNVWKQNSQVSAFIYNRIRTSLGPKGAYRIVTYNKGPEKVVKLCKDVIPVLEELGMNYPLIRILGEAAKMQKDEIGDGSTQFVLLTTSLLERSSRQHYSKWLPKSNKKS